jgi:hypothetical protein
LAPNNPHALILDWWRRLERAIDYYFVAYYGRRRPTVIEYLEVFEADPQIGAAAASEIDRMRLRRNEIAHGTDNPLSPAEAAAFAERALDLEWTIGCAVPDQLALETGAGRVV